MVDAVVEQINIETLEKLSPNELTRRVLEPGVDWIKGPLRERWSSLQKDHNRLVREGKFGKQMAVICEELANLQRDLARYLHLVSLNRQVAFQLEPSIINALFGNHEEAVTTSMGKGNVERMKGSVVGTISNLTLWYLVNFANPKLTKRLDFSGMVVGGRSDSYFKIDAVLDFGTKKGDKRTVRIITLKADESPVVTIDNIYPESLKSNYLGGTVKKSDAERMIQGAGSLYPAETYHCYFFAVGLPSFESVVIRNVFGIIHPDYPDKQQFLDDFIEKAFDTKLLPNIRS